MQVIAETVSRGFDALLGERLFSPRAFCVTVGASLCFTQCSIFFFGAFADFVNHLHGKPSGSVLLDIFRVCAFGCFGVLPAFFRSRWFLGFWFCMVLIQWRYLIPVGLFLLRSRGSSSASHFVEFVVACLLLSYSCDVLYVLVTRMTLRKVQKRHGVGTVLMMLGNLASCVFFVFGPILGGVAILAWYGKPSLPLAGVLIASPAVNAIDIVASGLAFVVASFALAYRFVFWPAIGRPLYSIARLSLNERRAIFWGAGILLWQSHWILDRLCKK